MTGKSILRAEPGESSAASAAALAVAAIVLALLTIVLVVSAADATLPRSPLPKPVHYALVGVPVVAVTYGGFQRHVLPPDPYAYGVTTPTVWTLRWVAVGLALPTAVVGVHLLVLNVEPVRATFDPVGLVAALAIGVAGTLPIAIIEELAFRGYLLRLLETRWNRTAAVIVPSIVFAAFHEGHATTAGELALVLGTTFLAGVLFALLALRTRSIWTPVAVHVGWNAVLGSEVVTIAPSVSATDSAVFAFRYANDGLLLTGGGASYATSALTGVLLALAVAWLHFDARRTGAATEVR